MRTKALALRSTTVAALAIAVDQALKAYVRQSLALCPAPPVSGCDRLDLAGPLGFVRVENAGSAFGFLQGLWLWLLLAALGILLVPLYGRRLGLAGWKAPLAVGLQVGGALANLADRLLYGGVTDFIDLGHGPIFNPADVALAIGMALAVRALLRRRASAAAVKPTSPALAGDGSEER
ncbi:MAG: signal peptidase II [Chloroflexi bacterium]|nr:signal peptidase II [Chloroflexota bacterium]